MLNYLNLNSIIDKDYGKSKRKPPFLYDFSSTPVNETAIHLLNDLKISEKDITYKHFGDFKFINKFSKLINVQEKFIRISAGGERALNLSTEILLAKNTKTLVSIPNFPRILLLTKYRSNNVKFVRVIDNLNEVEKKIKTSEVIYLTNPTTPLGKYFDFNSISKLIKENKDKMFVIDMCLLDFTGKYKDVLNKLVNFPNVILVLSFSKCLGLPGLRIGAFLTSNFKLLKAFDKLSSAFEVSTLSLQVCELIFKKQLPNIVKRQNKLMFDNYKLLQNTKLLNITFTNDNCFVTTLISNNRENLYNNLLNKGFNTLDVKYFDGMENINGVRINMNSLPLNFLHLLR